MRFFLLILILSLVSVSCGQKGGSSKAKFKIFSGNLVDPQVQFPGGLLVMGRKLDNSQSFIVAYTPTLELELKKGLWEFATIGWMGANKLEGNQQCSYQKNDVITDAFSVTFDMSYQKCLGDSTVEGKRFTEPYFYNLASGTLNGFKKLDIATCIDLVSSCSTFNNPSSFLIEIPPHLNGISPVSGISGLASTCVNGVTSNFTPPYGGASNGFIGMKIVYFSGTSCTGVAKEYFFDHGFGERLDKSFLDTSGVTQIRKAALSLDPTAANSNLALVPFKFMGAWTNTSAFPAAAANDLYFYKGASMLSIPPYPTPGQYMHYDGVSWTTISEAPSVKLILQEY